MPPNIFICVRGVSGRAASGCASPASRRRPCHLLMRGRREAQRTNAGVHRSDAAGDAASSRCHAALTLGKARTQVDLRPRPSRTSRPRHGVGRAVPQAAALARLPCTGIRPHPLGSGPGVAASPPAPRLGYAASLSVGPGERRRSSAQLGAATSRAGVLQGLRGRLALTCAAWVGERAGRALLRRVRGPAGRGRRRGTHTQTMARRERRTWLGQPGHRRGAARRVGALRRPGRLDHFAEGRDAEEVRETLSHYFDPSDVVGRTAARWRSSSATR